MTCISWCTARSQFLAQLDREVPAELDVHLILDNYATHKTPEIRRWLARHPRFHLHFTPTSSSWLNLVERLFAELTTRMLRRGVHRSVTELEADIRAWIDHWTKKSSTRSAPTANDFLRQLTTQDTRDE